MFGFFKRNDPNLLDDPIARVLSDMDTYGPDSPEYKKLVKHLERLIRMKAETRKPRVSRDTMWIVVGNLAGILAIVAYEQKHVWSSKGLSEILKPKPGNIPKL